MIRPFKESDSAAAMQIWLDANIGVHDFIDKEYWLRNLEAVKRAFTESEIYVHEDEDSNRIDGFIGLSGEYIEGLFVQERSRSRGIGKRLLDYAKSIKPALSLKAYGKNVWAARFYLRERFVFESEGIDENVNEKEITMTWRR